jgi:hypothetical protein
VTIATSASWSIAKFAGVASNPTSTSSSRAAASAWRAIRATMPGTVSPVRSRMLATWPSARAHDGLVDAGRDPQRRRIDDAKDRAAGDDGRADLRLPTTMPSSGEAIRVNRGRCQ